MAVSKGRKKRDPASGETTGMFARVLPETRAALNEGAAALGIGLAAYIDLLVAQATNGGKSLPAWARDRIKEEQLPLRDSA
jgi:hypothetical protein